jgi:hypothetical protein
VGGKTLDIQEFVELAHGREPPGRGRRLQPALVETGEIGTHDARLGLDCLDALRAQKSLVIVEIAPIGRERVFRRASLGGEHVEENSNEAGRRGAHFEGRREAGMVTVISRGSGSTRVASANIAA